MPLLQINKGTGDHANVWINGYNFDFDFSGLSISSIKIDSENQLVYNLGTNYYSKYTPPSSQMFPVMNRGTTAIQKSSATGSVFITPKWRRI